MAKRREEKPAKHKDIEGFLKEFLREESDRSVAILGAVFLDEYLKELIASFLVDDSKKVHDLLEGSLAPLGTFGSRIGAAYCMGLISQDAYHDLHIVREIRNKFAHELHGLSFSDTWVKNRCAELWLANKKKAPLVPGAPEDRQLFSRTVVVLFFELLQATVEQIKQRRVVPTR